jgi:WD40 repeat protein
MLVGGAQLNRKTPVPSLPQIPDHTLRRVIGRGAYGEVWLARNVMGAPRAVKIVWRQQFDSERPYEREFAGIQRYEPVSRTADGLVHVLHVGRNDAEGYFYYVMELADSVFSNEDSLLNWNEKRPDLLTDPMTAEYSPRTLRSDLKQLGRLPVADCLRGALDVVGGLARLHERGLVHRDVKPGNIIFVEGRAKLADIGLVSKESEGRTFVGTEGYIPPEGPGAPGADLYALGMVLYEAVTGHPPDHFPKVPTEWFREDGSTEALEFHAVVLKACEGDKERRYQNAEEMQADLALLQSGQSVRRLRALEERVTRWRRIGGVAAACVAIALPTALVANWRAKVAAESRFKEAKMLEQAQSSLARADRAEQESRLQLYTALLEQARATVRGGEMGQRVRALDAIRRAAAISNSVDLRREAVAALALPDLEFQRELVYGTEYSLRQLDPTFARIALSRSRGPIEIHSVADDRLLATLPASTNLICYSALWSGDARFLAANRAYDRNGHRNDLEVWDLKDAPRRVAVIPQARWNARAFHPIHPQLIVAGSGGLVTLWDLNTGEEIRRGRFEATPRELAFSPDGRFTAALYERTGGWGISIYDAADGTQICSNVLGSQAVSLSWHPSSRTVAFSDLGGSIYLMDANSGRLHLLGRHTAEAVNTTFNADGRYLITGAWGRELICWDVLRQERAFTIGLESYVAQFRADGLVCATWTDEGARLHSFHRPTLHRELKEELVPRVRHAMLSLDGQWLAASSDERVGVWHLANPGPAAFANNASDSRMFWSSDGELFASRSRWNDGFRWRVHPALNDSTSPVLQQLPLFKPNQFNSLSVSSNRIVWTSNGGSRVAETKHAGVEEGDQLPTEGSVNGLSADGRWLAIYEPYTPNISVYRLPDVSKVTSMVCKARVSGFAFSPSGDELAVVSRGQVEFWSTATWAPTRIATNFTALPGNGVLFQTDGRAMWLARGVRRAGLHDSKTFEPLLPLPTGMLPLALSADGTQLVASIDGRRLQIWELPPLRKELAALGLSW